jgi:signal transduction histidine kinase
MSHVAGLGAQHLKLSTFDLRDVWTECVDAGRQILNEKSLKLAQQIPQEPFVIMGDREKFAYVFSELIAAAVIFSDKEGTITAEFSRGREGEVNVKISEKDAGIPAELLNTIFERSFNTISKPVVRGAEPGTVSLSGVYDIVGMHGGRVFVNSTAGQGAAFLFTLPAVIADGEETSHEQAVNSSRRRR